MHFINKKEEIIGAFILLNGIIGCVSDRGWTAYHDAPALRDITRRHRNTPVSFHSAYQGQYDLPSFGLENQHRTPSDTIYHASNRQSHSYIPPSRYNGNLVQGHNPHSPSHDYLGFGPTSYSRLTSHVSLDPAHDSFSHNPIIITSSENPHVLSDSPYSMGHLSIVTASPLSLGPSHAGFLSASSSLRVADHFSKPSINKGYKVTEDESNERSDSHSQIFKTANQNPGHITGPHRSSNDRSSSVHTPDSKATSYQSFILHSFKPIKVMPKKRDDHATDDAASNEISHKI